MKSNNRREFLKKSIIRITGAALLPADLKSGLAGVTRGKDGETLNTMQY